MEGIWDKCTVTFSNDTNISLREIQQIFSNFSKFVNIHDYDGKVFVTLGSEEEAACAVYCLKNVLKLDYAMKRIVNDNSRKMNDDYGISHWKSTSLRGNYHDNSRSNNSLYTKLMSKTNITETAKTIQSTENLQNLGDSRKLSNSGFTPSPYFTPKNFPDQGSSIVESVKSFNIDDSSQSSDSMVTTTLIDMKNLQKMYPIILVNLPGPFTVQDVLNLVEECEPIALTELQHTQRNKLKFCEIYLKSSDDIAYLKKKLDRFVIGGKKLMAVEPSECLLGHKWIL